MSATSKEKNPAIVAAVIGLLGVILAAVINGFFSLGVKETPASVQPGHVSASMTHFNLGQLYFGQKNYAAAEKEYKQCLNNSWAHSGLGVAK